MQRAKPTRDAVEALRASPVVYADETGQGGRRVWLWVFTTCARPSRSSEQAASVLGKNYAGTLRRLGPLPLLQGSGYRPATTIRTVATSYTATRGAVRFPRLVKAIRHALALRDRRDAGEISPHGLRVAKGLLQAKMNRLLHGRFTNPANQRLNICDASNLFVFLACGRRGSRRTRHSHQPQDLRRRQPYRERGTGPVDPHTAVTKGSA